MLKECLFAILRPFLTAYALWRYKSIWGLKAHLQTHKNKLMELTYLHYFMQRGSFVGLTSTFATLPCLPHGVQGIFVSNNAKIGRDVVIFQHVTIGSSLLSDSKHPGSPVIGDRVYIGAGAKIIGNVRIGNGCRIGANAVVYQDMPDNAVAVCASTRILQKEALDNTYTTTVGGRDYYFRDGEFHAGKP